MDNPTGILIVFPGRDERASIRGMLDRPDWRLYFATTVEGARRTLCTAPIDVVISTMHFPDGQSWKDLLNEIENKGIGVPLIVTDRAADSHTWGEVLNLGGYDLLAEPLKAREVFHVVISALRSHGRNGKLLPRLRESEARNDSVSRVSSPAE